ncbi:MAG: inosamine-phosphate amidinotransferase 1 [Proteobacteria bacterium]|nr:inosamine-phosphate amidinotransferase 1 [Pseudomonadota bacterium]MBU1687340.1 inosamine-phosphate amidinotransferase 1 [Pseudomonadota bacterium]
MSEKIKVHTHNEWDPLREIIIGTIDGAQMPSVKDEALHSINYGNVSDEEFAKVRTGPYPDQVIEETREDLSLFVEALEKRGVRVHRSSGADFSKHYSTPDWSVDGYYAYCPRDSIFTVADQAIETPMVLRHRQNEAERILRHLFAETFIAPRPRLLDSMYDRSVLGRFTLCNEEPAFDAANLLKCGRDIIFQISNTGNYLGVEWLQNHLGPGYRIHPVDNVYAFIHIDSTIIPLRPGLVLLCPDRVKPENVPSFFAKWDKIWAPEPNPMSCDHRLDPASKWIAMNIMSLSPDLVVVEKNQHNLMRALEKHGIDSMPIQLRHMRSLGGGPHCITLDVWRDGELEDYS